MRQNDHRKGTAPGNEPWFYGYGPVNRTPDGNAHSADFQNSWGITFSETGILQQLQTAAAQSRIISTGGGIIIRPENRLLLKKLGFVVWLHTDVNILYQRISRCTNRPLLQQPNPKAVLEHLMKERHDFYRETAHLTIDTANLHIHEIAFGILESARVFRSRRQ